MHRILLDMTSKIGERASEISAAVDILAGLDLQFAKAKFAEDYDCVAPMFNASEGARSLSLPQLEREGGGFDFLD